MLNILENFPENLPITSMCYLSSTYNFNVLNVIIVSKNYFQCIIHAKQIYWKKSLRYDWDFWFEEREPVWYALFMFMFPHVHLSFNFEMKLSEISTIFSCAVL